MYEIGDTLDIEKSTFETLHQESWPFIFNLAYQKLGDPDEAYDLVQELFIELWDKRAVFPPDSISIGWLKKRLWYKLLTHFRTQGFRQQQLADFRVFLESEHEVYREQDWQDSLIYEKEFNAIMEAIALVVTQMPERMQQIYLLNKEQHFSVQEIAERLGISPHTVRYHLQEAMKRLRDSLTSTDFSLVNYLLVFWVIG